MKHIKIINSLILTSEGVASKHRNGKPHDFFIKQGDLDGACAPYSASMLLMILGVLKRGDLYLDKTLKLSSRIGKIVDLFFNQKGLVRSGYDFEELTNELQVFKKDFSIQCHNNDSNVLDIIEQQILAEMPVLISVEYSGGAHALVAIGLEYNDREDVTKIFCIDPAFDKPTLTYWNSVIDIETEFRGKYNFNWLNDNIPMKLSDLITFERK